jgi:hypothetical protein
MKVIQQEDTKIYAMPGDTFRLLYKGEVLLEEPITKQMAIDTLMIVQIEDGDLGLKSGIGGIFGEKKKETKKASKKKGV